MQTTAFEFEHSQPRHSGHFQSPQLAHCPDEVSAAKYSPHAAHASRQSELWRVRLSGRVDVATAITRPSWSATSIRTSVSAQPVE